MWILEESARRQPRCRHQGLRGEPSMQLLKLCKRSMQAPSEHFNGNLPVVHRQLCNGIMSFTPPRRLPSLDQEEHTLDAAKMLFFPAKVRDRRIPWSVRLCSPRCPERVSLMSRCPVIKAALSAWLPLALDLLAFPLPLDVRRSSSHRAHAWEASTVTSTSAYLPDKVGAMLVIRRSPGCGASRSAGECLSA